MAKPGDVELAILDLTSRSTNRKVSCLLTNTIAQSETFESMKQNNSEKWKGLKLSWPYPHDQVQLYSRFSLSKSRFWSSCDIKWFSVRTL